MADTEIKKLVRTLVQLFRTLMFAYMIGIANIVKEETRFVDDSHIKMEYKQEATDDDQLKDLEKPNND